MRSETKARAGVNVFGFQVNRHRPGHAYIPTVGLWGVNQPYPRDFLEAATPILDRDDTLLDLPRLYVLWQAVRNTSSRDADDIAEVGVYKGGSVELMAAGADDECMVYAIDTFSGHPASAISEHDSVHRAGMFSDLDPVAVGRRLGKLGICVIAKEFGQAPIPAPCFSVVHLDTDLYKSTLDGLLYFGPRMAQAGVIVVDDYGSAKANGVRKAVDRYRALAPERFQMWTMQTKQAVLIARAGVR